MTRKVDRSTVTLITQRGPYAVVAVSNHWQILDLRVDRMVAGKTFIQYAKAVEMAEILQTQLLNGGSHR